MSDFYRRRRVVIKDATALLTFFLGFVWSGAFAWPFLTDQLDQGQMIRGLAYFLGAVLGAAVVMGAIGLELGNLLGGLWEHYHKHHRTFGTGAMATAGAAPGGAPMLAWAGGTPVPMAPPDNTRVAPRTRDTATIRYDEASVDATSYIPLAERVSPNRYELPRVRAALTRTTNIAAWDGGRLVGVVRLLTDGYTFSAVADIVVDPDYQRRGIGRALMQRALAAAPDARLLVEAAPDCVRFFERIGAERGPTGFILTAPARR